MKSVIQEASSLCKAIEQGWLKAGKPKEFSIRILQEPYKNFLGMTTQNAKIAVFFGRIGEPKPFKPERKEQAQQRPQPQRRRPQPQGGYNKRHAFKKPNKDNN